jgi:hypothetical protein
VAAVNCASVQPGPSLRPLVVQFSDLYAAEEWFDGNTTGFIDRDDRSDGQLLSQLGAPYNPRGHNLRRSRPSRHGDQRARRMTTGTVDLVREDC